VNGFLGRIPETFLLLLWWWFAASSSLLPFPRFGGGFALGMVARRCWILVAVAAVAAGRRRIIGRLETMIPHSANGLFERVKEWRGSTAAAAAGLLSLCITFVGMVILLNCVKGDG